MTEESEAEAEKNVRDTVLAVYAAVQALDVDLLDSYFSTSDEILAFGQHWKSRSKSWEQISTEHKTEFRALTSLSMTSDELEVHVRGTVAWTADRAHQTVVTKDGQTFDSDVRLTLVLEQQKPAGNWLIVQWHASRGL